MAIAVDAMGGDRAPAEIVAGAVEAVRQLRIPLFLIGPQQQVQDELDRLRFRDSLITVVDAPEWIGMEESPGVAVRRKRDSSIARATALVESGQAEAVVSAGNSGAAMAEAMLKLGTLPGVERPAIATLFPSHRGKVVVLDVGANVDCKPRHLLQFARMGAVYAHRVLGVENPRVGLLSIGEEPSKGNELTKEAHKLIGNSDLYFIGNLEGKDLFSGVADVAVCDGFVGNIVLKVTEGVAEMFTTILKRELTRHRVYMLGQFLLKGAWQGFRRQLDYAEYGGALLLGVKGVCVICHGRSNAKAVMSAIRVAQESVQHQAVNAIAASIQAAEPAPVAAAEKSSAT